MKIHRPLWSEGAFLSPEQFQQQSRWEAFSNDQIAKLSLANPWGTQRVSFDSQALSLNKLNAESLSVRFPDGTWIDTDVSEALPPARDLLQSIRDQERSKSEQDDLATRLAVLKKNVPALLHDSNGLKLDVTPLLTESKEICE